MSEVEAHAAVAKSMSHDSRAQGDEVLPSGRNGIRLLKSRISVRWTKPDSCGTAGLKLLKQSLPRTAPLDSLAFRQNRYFAASRNWLRLRAGKTATSYVV